MPSRSYHYLKIILLIFLGLAFLFFASSLIYYYQHQSEEEKTLVNPIPDQDVVSKFAALPTISPAKKEFNVLLLGHGNPSHPGGDLADSLIILHLDADKKQAALISIPRDTWVALPVSEDKMENHKINEAYLVGKKTGGEENGFNLIKQAVTKVTNLPIHYYISIDFSGFNRAIDTLGGITVDVSQAFDDYFYPVKGKELDNCGKAPEELAAINATMSGFELEKQYSCRYEYLHFDIGQTKMNGETALKFVRSRHSNQAGGDFSRGARQQALLIGIKDKLLSLGALEKAPTLFDQLVKMVKTDLDKQVVKTAVEMIVDPNNYSIFQVVLSTDNVFNSSKSSSGQYILVPKAGVDQWEEIHQYLNQQI